MRVSSSQWNACRCQLCPKVLSGHTKLSWMDTGLRPSAVPATRHSSLAERTSSIKKFGFIADALKRLPDGTVIDGELVALDANGRPNFNLLQNFRSAESQISYFVFDILVHKNRDLTRLPLSERRRILRSVVEPTEHIGLSEVSDRTAAEMLKFVREHGLEGLVAKRADGVYQPGLRSGLWSKHRINLGQEFVVGGYVPSNLGLDSLVVGFYRGKELIYASRVRAGFIPATRRKVFDQIKHLTTTKVPIRQPAGARSGQMGPGTNRRENEGVRLAQAQMLSLRSNSWSGPGPTTLDIPSSSECGTTKIPVKSSGKPNNQPKLTARLKKHSKA